MAQFETKKKTEKYLKQNLKCHIVQQHSRPRIEKLSQIVFKWVPFSLLLLHVKLAFSFHDHRKKNDNEKITFHSNPFEMSLFFDKKLIRLGINLCLEGMSVRLVEEAKT